MLATSRGALKTPDADTERIQNLDPDSQPDMVVPTARVELGNESLNPKPSNPKPLAPPEPAVDRLRHVLVRHLVAAQVEIESKT